MTALPHESPPGAGENGANAGHTPQPPRRSLAARRAWQRRLQRQRVARRTTVSRDGSSACADPLLRPQSRGWQRYGSILLLILGSIVVHGFVVVGLALFGELLSHAGHELARNVERLEIAVIETPKPPPAPPETPRQKTQRAVRKALPPPIAKKPEPPPDSINEPKELPESSRRLRRIVGVSFASTTIGGGGPAFAVGNTRMGETDRVARDPREVSELPKKNRVSHRVPTAKVKFDPPEKLERVEPEYPPALRAQGIEADVVLVVTVGEDGRVKNVRVVDAAFESAFNVAAKAAAEQERYRPARKNDVPVEHVITFTVRFRLTEL